MQKFPLSGKKGTERKVTMGAFLGEFLFEAIRMIVLAAVCVGAIFCGKKLRDRKNAKTAASEK